MADYTLPELAYDYAALEPHISAKTLELHHGKHHAAYVKGANETLAKLDEARGKQDFERLPALERALAFHLSGHILHSLFWSNLKPKAGGAPSGDLAAAITRDFGSFDAFRAQLTKAAETIMGSGWAALVYEPVAKRLLTTQIYDHQSNVGQAAVPILVLDAWEHAYYLQYQNRKTEFFQAVWNLWNWDDIGQRYLQARRTDLLLRSSAR